MKLTDLTSSPDWSKGTFISAGEESEFTGVSGLFCVNFKVPVLLKLLPLTPAVTELPKPEKPEPETAESYPAEVAVPHAPQFPRLPSVTVLDLDCTVEVTDTV